MFRPLLFWLFSLTGFSVGASSMIDVSPKEIIEDNNSSYLIIDVRTPKEFSIGHVPNAVNIPLDDIPANIEKFKRLGNKKIVLYCRSGYRANKASDILQQNGLTDIHHLEGDMLGWIESKLPIEK